MNEKSQVPEGYKKTELAAVPEEWEVCEFRNYLDIKSGKGFRMEEYSESGIKLLRIDNVSHGKIMWDTIAFLPNDYETEYPDLMLNEGDILLALNRPITQNKLKIAILKYTDIPAILYQRVGKITFNKNVDRLYVYYWLNQFLPTFILRKAVGSDQPFINLTDLRNLTFFLPSEAEQQKIASILSKVDEQIEQTEQIIEKTEILKKGLMQKLLTKGIGHTNFKKTELGEIPEEWKVVTIKEVTRDDKRAIKVGPFGSQLKKSEYVDSGIKVYGQENVFRKDFNYGNYYITKEKFESLSAFEIFPDDVVITMMGTIGDCMVVPKNISKGIMNSHLMRLQLKFNIIPEFLAILIKDAFYVKKQINKLSQGAIMSGLNSTIIKQISIPLPSINEQIKLVEICNKIQDLSNREINYLTQLQELKKGLMQDLLTGKVRVCI